MKTCLHSLIELLVTECLDDISEASGAGGGGAVGNTVSSAMGNGGGYILPLGMENDADVEKNKKLPGRKKTTRKPSSKKK